MQAYAVTVHLFLRHNKAHFMSHRAITIPIIIEYEAVACDLEPVGTLSASDSDLARFRCVPVRHAKSCLLDPWKLRDEFLSLQPENWQAFIAMTGWFCPFPISRNYFQRCQEFVVKALLQPASEWAALEKGLGDLDSRLRLSSEKQISFQWDGEVPVAKIHTIWSLGAIFATVQIEKLQKAEFRRCARSDCKNPPFRVETEHKIYCSSDCAHLVAVRNSRKRQAEAAQKKGAKRNAKG
jgi:hypothetical protein